MMLLVQAILPVVREMGEKKGHVRQDALVIRLTLVAAAPWKMLSSRSACTAPPFYIHLACLVWSFLPAEAAATTPQFPSKIMNEAIVQLCGRRQVF